MLISPRHLHEITAAASLERFHRINGNFTGHFGRGYYHHHHHHRIFVVHRLRENHNSGALHNIVT